MFLKYKIDHSLQPQNQTHSFVASQLAAEFANRAALINGNILLECPGRIQRQAC